MATMSENNFYVYLHTRATDGVVFYVGKGRGGRYKSKAGRNLYWQRVVSRHGFNAEILFDGLSEPDALIAEVDAIKELRHFGFRLCNFVDGGGGTSGWRHSDEIKAQIRRNHAKYWVGKSRSKATAKIISETKKARGQSIGDKNPSYDKTVYLFLSPAGDVVKSTKYDLYTNNKELTQPKVSLLVSGKRKTTQGWRFIGVCQ